MVRGPTPDLDPARYGLVPVVAEERLGLVFVTQEGDAAGDTVWAQAWFRDPPSPKTTHLSDGLEFVVCP